jgi:hypothetical protein
LRFFDLGYLAKIGGTSPEKGQKRVKKTLLSQKRWKKTSFMESDVGRRDAERGY